MDGYRHIGKETPRLAARKFVTGKAEYAKDLKIPEMLYGKVLRSPYAHCKITNIDTTKAEKLSGVEAVLTYKNTPDWKLGMPIQHKRILEEKAHYFGDAVALVAAKTEAICEEALDLIEVEYEELEHILTIDEALNPESPQLYPEYPGNVIPGEMYKKLGMALVETHYGDTEKGFSEADVIVEGDSYVVNGQNPLPPEPPGIIAEWDEDDLILKGSMSSAGISRFFNANGLQMHMSHMRVIPAYVGGSYGSKHISGSGHIILYAAALAKATRKPVGMFFTKNEHIATYATRLNSKGHYKIGMKKNGTITALSGEWLADCGALSAEQAMMVSVGLISQSILAKSDNVDINSKIVLTNKVPTGAYRGFGYLENGIHISNVLFKALEKIDMDPVDYFKHNRLHVGDHFFHAYMCSGMETCAGPDIIGALEEGSKTFAWQKKWKGWGKPTSIQGNKIRAVGVGLAGQSDVGEQSSNENVQLNFDGSATVYCGATEFGPGTRDVMVKMAAEVLNLPLDLVKITSPDTLSTPYEWGSTGSRSTYSMGSAVVMAAKEAKKQLLERASKVLDCSPNDLDTKDSMVYLKNKPEIRIPWIAAIGIHKSITGVGYFHGAYNITVHQFQFVELEVDVETGKISVLEQLCSTDCGQVVNPLSLKGQLDGYFPGIDLALRERTIWDKDGRIVNPNMIDYKTRTFNEIPKHENVLLETPPNSDPEAPFGAFGAGEPSLAPGIPAITMALYNATGHWFNNYPITPACIQENLKK